MRYVFLLFLVAAGCELDTSGLAAYQPTAVQVGPDGQAPAASVQQAPDAGAEAPGPKDFPACGDIPGGVVGALAMCAAGMNWVCEKGCVGPHDDLLREVGLPACQTHQNVSFSDAVETICVRDCAQCPN